MKKIAVEEHFFTQTYVDYRKANMKKGHVAPRPGEIDDCIDVGAGRLKAMDDAGIDMQVLSFSSPGVEGIENADDAATIARKTNDELAAIIKKTPHQVCRFRHDRLPQSKDSCR